MEAKTDLSASATTVSESKTPEPKNDKGLIPLPLFVVDTPPFIHYGYTISHMMYDTMLALLPAAVMAVLAFGLPALRVLLLSAGTAVLVEALCLKLGGKDIRIYDCTALVCGLVFAFLLPAGVPWWLVVIGSTVSIVLGKQVFGGLGCNPLCPPLVGWAVLTVSWPMYMDPSSVILNTELIDPLLKLKFFGQAVPIGSELSLFFGQQLGGLGSCQIAAVLAGGLFLVLRRAVRWEIPFSYLLGVLITGAVFHYWTDIWALLGSTAEPLAASSATPAPLFYFLTGSTVFAAFFLATEAASSPVAFAGMLIYGLLAGFLTVIIRIYGQYPDGAPFGILLASLMTPLLDLVRPAPFGKRR